MIITSKNNDMIKYLRKQKDNKFLLFLDNPKTIIEAKESGLTLKHILINQDKQELLNKFKTEPNLIVVSSEIISSLTTTQTPQGIVAVFDFPHKELQPPKTNFLVLDTVQDAGNVGTLLRSCKGAGFNSVILIDSARLSNEKTIRSSMGAIFGLNLYETTKPKFLEFVKKINLPLICADMDGENVFEYTNNQPFGLVLGNEGKGVSKEIKELCTGAIKIPMLNNLESLNVAVAGSIIMFEIINKRKK